MVLGAVHEIYQRYEMKLERLEKEIAQRSNDGLRKLISNYETSPLNRFLFKFDFFEFFDKTKRYVLAKRILEGKASLGKQYQQRLF